MTDNLLPIVQKDSHLHVCSADPVQLRRDKATSSDRLDYIMALRHATPALGGDEISIMTYCRSFSIDIVKF
jgi:hypothetical protein